MASAPAWSTTLEPLGAPVPFPPSDLSGELCFRSIFLSDLHLGCWGCEAEKILDFLGSVRARYLYLVGDIIDLWQLRHSLYWPRSHSAVIHRLVALARSGTEVIYLPGNHDTSLRTLEGLALGDLHFCDRVIHTAADGRRYLVMHGDQCDAVVRLSPALARFGGRLYDLLCRLNRRLNHRRISSGQSPISLSGRLKRLVKRTCLAGSRFRVHLTREARLAGVDGVICGHVHEPAREQLADGPTYYNCGDWVESCSAVVEQFNGRLAVLSWASLAGGR